MASKGSRVLRSLFLRMIVVTALAGAGAAWLSLQMEDRFRARVLLILAPLPFEHVDETITQVAVGDKYRPRANYLKVSWLQALPMEDYKMLLTGDEMVRKVRDYMAGLYAERGLDAGNLTLERVRRAMDVRVKIFMQTQQELEYQQVVELLLTGTSPEIAADAANFWAEASIEYALRMRQLAREGALDFLDKQIEEVNGRLTAARGGLEEIFRAADIEGLRAELSDLQRAATERRLSIARFTEEIAGLEAEAAALEALRGEGLDLAASRRLEERLVLARGELAALRARRAALEEIASVHAPEIAALREMLASQERRHSEYGIQIAYYERQLEELEMSHYAARMSSAETGPEFKFASPAAPPEEKIAPWRSLIVLVSMFLACAAVPVQFFTMIALRRYAEQLDTAS